MRRASALLERLAAPPVRTTQERYRHELKYLINEGEHAALACRMAPVFKLDKHARAGGYTIRSLYFDDYCNSAYEEKDAGILMRKKYRVRIYNGSDKVLSLSAKRSAAAGSTRRTRRLRAASLSRFWLATTTFCCGAPIRSVASSTSSASAI